MPAFVASARGHVAEHQAGRRPGGRRPTGDLPSPRRDPPSNAARLPAVPLRRRSKSRPDPRQRDTPIRPRLGARARTSTEAAVDRATSRHSRAKVAADPAARLTSRCVSPERTHDRTARRLPRSARRWTDTVSPKHASTMKRPGAGWLCDHSSPLCSSLGPGGCADRTTIPDRGGRALVSPSPRSSRSISIGVLGTPRLRSLSW